MKVSRIQHRVVDAAAWKSHFQHMADSTSGCKSFYKVKTKDNEPAPLSEQIRLVSETASSVAQAQKQVKEEAKLLKLQPGMHDLKLKRLPPLKRNKKRIVEKSQQDDIFND